MFYTEGMDVLFPLFLSASLPLLAFLLLGRRSDTARVIVSIGCLCFAARYLWWRWTVSIPADQIWWQGGISLTFLMLETLSTVGTMSVYVFMSRTKDRSAEVDAHSTASTLAAPVDVFIATYNEGREILERTVVGALHIDHPDLRVWVLDDGARPWLREMAERLGAHYIFRHKGQHAKAGNVNNAIKAAVASDRSPEFILLLDADFVASRAILKRTLPLMENHDVGVVQTPQHFYNHDPIQTNLFCSDHWPDEQRFFFNHLMPGKDAWGAAFCCGTSALFRMEALLACGGLATQTVTEDMLTSFVLREHGYRTVFLNERLSLGLAPEGLDEFVSQRQRWCLGAIQQLRTRWSFFGSGRVGLANRVSSLEGTIFWTATFAFRICTIIAPLLYWWLNTAVIDCNGRDMIYWMAPNIVGGMIFTALLAGNTVFPILTDATHLLAAPAVIGSALVGLIKPWGHPFKVTAKGLDSKEYVVHWRMLTPFAGIAILTLAGLSLNITTYSSLAGDKAYTMNVIWSIFNIIILSVVCTSCVEAPKAGAMRFSTNERASISYGGETSFPCVLHEMSLETANLSCNHLKGDARSGELLLDHGSLRIPFVAKQSEFIDQMSVIFLHTEASRHAMIRKLFTGRYHNDVEQIHALTGLIAATRRMLC